jgi:hypothetical protein
MNESAKRIAELFFGKTEPGCCVICKKEVNVETEFDDVASIAEWQITQMCQSCQDDTFAEPEEDGDVGYGMDGGEEF